jgi:hypothetical protein
VIGPSDQTMAGVEAGPEDAAGRGAGTDVVATVDVDVVVATVDVDVVVDDVVVVVAGEPGLLEGYPVSTVRGCPR